MGLLALGLSLVLGRRRSFASDSAVVMNANPYPRRIEGVVNVPASGRYVLVMNHFNRVGLRPYHCAMVVSAALSSRSDKTEICWALTSEMYGKHFGPLPIPVPLVRWTLSRVARIYGFVILPRRPELVEGRAVGLRRLLRALTEQPVGVMPEAAGTGTLVTPPAGSGLFLAALARRAKLLPVAAWEEDDGMFVLRFGEPFDVTAQQTGRKRDADSLLRDQVMVAIGRLLPEQFWGVYQAAIRQSYSPSSG
jgi:hypothetical protein